MTKLGANVLEKFYFGKGKQNDPYMIEIYQMPGANLNRDQEIHKADAVHTRCIPFEEIPEEMVKGLSTLCKMKFQRDF